MARVILFDVNETLLDLRALDPPFERAFGRASVRHEWFGQLLQSAFVSTITDSYADFGTILDPLVPARDVVGADLDEVADKILTAEFGL